MEYLDIFDENNNPTNQVKDKDKAHEDGNFHRTAHVWIINDKLELLIQRRSSTKKIHPNCWDISSAGYIKAGESAVQGAIRELKEELGVTAKENELEYITTVKSIKNPKNHEFQYVYLLNCKIPIEQYIFEDKEVSEVKYVYFEELEKMVADKVDGLLIHDEEYNKLFKYIKENYKRIIHMEYSFRKCILEDFDFLFNLKKENFKWYVDKIWGWQDNEQKQRLKQDLSEHLAHKRIIMYENKPIGVYAIHSTENGDLFINEISITKEYQNKGIGRDILEKQLNENYKKGIRTILQVFKDNPAKKLYESLGFTVYGETETHYQMEKVR